MNKINPSIPMLQFPRFAEDCNIFHFITTRQGGVSQGSYESFNLGEYAGDRPEYVEENRIRFCASIGIQPDRLFIPYQVHEDKIAMLDNSFLSLDRSRQNSFLRGKDALITSIPGLCLAVTTADCVPVILYDPQKRIIAAIHAGWRGTVKQIISKVIVCMQKTYTSDPAHIIAGIGPCIGPKAFEVGEEVVREFREASLLVDDTFFRHPVSGKGHIDLALTNKKQLMSSGLKEENIFLSHICTYENEESFFSARRLGVQSGRFLTGIYLK